MAFRVCQILFCLVTVDKDSQFLNNHEGLISALNI